MLAADHREALERLRLRPGQIRMGAATRFVLLAETPGTYPLRLIDEDRQIGTLEIR